MVWASRAGLAQGQRGFWSIRSGEGAGQGTGRQGKKRTPGVVVKEFGVLEGQGMPAAWALPVWGVGHVGLLSGEMDILGSWWGDRRGATLLENLATGGAGAWSRLSGVRDAAFAAEFLVPQRRSLPLPNFSGRKL